MTNPTTSWIVLFAAAAAGCNMLKPLTDDKTIDAPPGPGPDAPPASLLLPAGSTVPDITSNAELTSQIKIFDGISDSQLTMANGILVRSTGKAGGATVKYWSFGAATIVDGFVASAPLYVIADPDGSGGYIPRAAHPFLIDTIPGDPRYSSIRRVIYVPTTATYAGELITSLAALDEALARGIVTDPVPAGTWRNLPVIQQGAKLEIATGMTGTPTIVFSHGYQVELWELGGALGVQPLRNNVPLGGQESRLLSGVATGVPPVLPTTPDAQPVFQYAIPAAPPMTTPNYTPIVTELDVRLATGVDPTMVNADNQMFARSAAGGITGFQPAEVDSFTVTATVSNKQIQFVDGAL